MRLKRTFFYILFASLAGAIYLFWFDNLGTYSGFTNTLTSPEIITIVVAVSFIVLLIGILIISILRREWYWLITLTPLGLLMPYFSRMIHGDKIYYFHECELSICCTFELYEDKTYFYYYFDQSKSISRKGTYEIKQNIIYLDEFERSDNNLGLQGQSEINLESCFYFRSEIFYIPFPERLSCNQITAANIGYATFGI